MSHQPDPVWGALIASELRVGPRLDPAQCRRCPACNLGPTLPVRVDAVVWVACESCGLYWALGVDAFVGRDWQEPQDDSEMLANMVYLAQLTPADAGQGDWMKTATTGASSATNGTAIDPRLFQQPREPQALMRNPEMRIAITSIVAKALKDHLVRDASGRLKVRPGLYSDVRAEPCDETGTMTVDQALRAAGIFDPCAAIGHLQDVLVNALGRREELQAQLKALDAVAQLCGVDQVSAPAVRR